MHCTCLLVPPSNLRVRRCHACLLRQVAASQHGSSLTGVPRRVLCILLRLSRARSIAPTRALFSVTLRAPTILSEFSKRLTHSEAHMGSFGCSTPNPPLLKIISQQLCDVTIVVTTNRYCQQRESSSAWKEGKDNVHEKSRLFWGVSKPQSQWEEPFGRE